MFLMAGKNETAQGETARALGMEEGAVRVAIHRLRKRLPRVVARRDFADAGRDESRWTRRCGPCLEPSPTDMNMDGKSFWIGLVVGAAVMLAVCVALLFGTAALMLKHKRAIAAKSYPATALLSASRATRR